MDPYTNFRRSGYGHSQLVRSDSKMTVGIQSCMQPPSPAPFSNSGSQAGAWLSSGSAGCPGTTFGPIETYPLGMGYVPMQQWSQTYSLDQGLSRGTIFPELDLPFVMGRCQ